MARRGYPFGTVRPRGDRNATTHTIGVAFVIDEGTRAYIERINIRGNTRTRDYVIRREMDINEGDPYNRALLDRAERRIKNLNFFKSVKITSEPGSAPDRVVVNVDVVEQSTGDFSVMGGFSTAEGWMVSGLGLRAQPVGNRPLCQSVGDLRRVRSLCRTRLRRAVFPRSADQRRHRSVCAGNAGQQLFLVRHGIDRRHAEIRHTAARRFCRATALFAVHAIDPAADVSWTTATTSIRISRPASPTCKP